MKSVKIGTRASALALAQTKLVTDALEALGFSTEVVRIQTLGDKKQGTTAARISDKREWIQELEDAVRSGAIDLAVHSGKDVPAAIHADTEITSVLERAVPWDLFIGQKGGKQRLTLQQVPRGGRVGTCSLRRAAQLKIIRPDLQIVECRGNVPTRLAKLTADVGLNGIVLAAAGIDRLGLHDTEFEILSAETLLPSVNQGILVFQYLRDGVGAEAGRKLAHPATQFAFLAERACVKALNGDCNSAMSIFAEVKAQQLLLRARVMMPDGSQLIEEAAEAEVSSATEIGLGVAEALLSRGAKAILEASIRRA